MCKPLLQTYLAITWNNEPDGLVMQNAYRSGDDYVATYPVGGRDHEHANKLAAREGADSYFFYDEAAVIVTVDGKPVVLRSDRLNVGAPKRVFHPARA